MQRALRLQLLSGNSKRKPYPLKKSDYRLVLEAAIKSNRPALHDQHGDFQSSVIFQAIGLARPRYRLICWRAKQRLAVCNLITRISVNAMVRIPIVSSHAYLYIPFVVSARSSFPQTELRFPSKLRHFACQIITHDHRFSIYIARFFYT